MPEIMSPYPAGLTMLVSSVEPLPRVPAAELDGELLADVAGVAEDWDSEGERRDERQEKGYVRTGDRIILGRIDPGNGHLDPALAEVDEWFSSPVHPDGISQLCGLSLATSSAGEFQVHLGRMSSTQWG